MKQSFYDALSANPIIAAVKDEAGVLACIENDIQVVFVLFGEISTIADIVERLKNAGKTVVVHLDLVTGLSVREESVRFIRKYTRADGVISTKPEMMKCAKELGLCTVFRVFAIDSKALDGMGHHVTEYADLIELLPGIMPRIIRRVADRVQTPIIAGGLISEREDVIEALDAGAIAISSTNKAVWEM